MTIAEVDICFDFLIYLKVFYPCFLHGERMGIINLQNVQVGMELARDLKDRSGRIILSSGNKIEVNHLRIFRMWGITELDIKGVEREEVAAQELSELDPIIVSNIEECLKNYFIHSNMEHPFIQELFHLLVIKLTHRKMKE